VSDDVLIDRLRQARKADRETLLALEPRYRSREFVARLLARLDQEPDLLPYAHEALAVATKYDSTLLTTYLQVAFGEVGRLRTAGENGQALDVLEQLEQAAHRCDNKLAAFNSKINRLVILQDAPDPALVIRVADGVVAAWPEVDLSRAPIDYVRSVSALLEQVARRAYYEALDADATVRLAEAANQITPNSAAELIAAMALLTSGKTERARDHYRRLATENPPFGMVQFNLAQCELVLGNTESGLAALRLACELSPNEGTYQLSAAQAFSQRGLIDDAVAMLDRAVPICERIAREQPERTLALLSGQRLPVKDAVAVVRLKVAGDASANGRSDVATRVLNALIADGDAIDIAHGCILKSRLAVQAGKADEAARWLDEAVAGDADLEFPRLARADFRIERGEFDRAMDDLAVVVRNTTNAHPAVERLERILETAPEHPAALKWLGCALTYWEMQSLERGIALLDRAIATDQTDSYALLRRALARITLRSGGEQEPTLSWQEVVAAVNDIGTAVALTPDDVEVQQAYRWLLDRVTANQKFFEWLLATNDRSGGVAVVAPRVWYAILAVVEAVEIGSKQGHREAVTLLEEAQSRLLKEGLPAFASRVDLFIADNLMRLDDLQGALDRLDIFDRAYQGIVTRPLTRSLHELHADMQAKRAERIQESIGWELEYMLIQSIGLDGPAALRAALAAQAQARVGNGKAASGTIEAFEKEVFATAKPTEQQVSFAAGMIQMLRDAGELVRARKLLEHVQPHAYGRHVISLAFTDATLLSQEGKLTEAAEIYRGLIVQPSQSPAVLKRAQVNLAGVVVQAAPAEALALVLPHLDDPSLPRRASLSLKLLAAHAAQASDEHELAGDCAEAVVNELVEMRATLTSADDRISWLGQYQAEVENALAILVDCGRAEAVLAAVEGIRSRGLAESMDARLLPESDELTAARTRVDTLKRVSAALSRLARGVDRFGARYSDAQALELLQATDASLELFDEKDRASLSVEALSHALEAATRRLEDARGELERQWFERSAVPVGDGASGASGIGGALARATKPGQRAVFVSLVVTSKELALVFASSDRSGAWLRSTGVSSRDFRALAGLSGLEERMEEEQARAELERAIAPIVEETQPGDIVVLGVAAFCARVPFHAVLVAGEPWCARNPICYAPSGAVLARCLALPPSDGPAVVVGDPRGDLPKARDEARAVAALLGVDAMLGGEATTEAVLERLTEVRAQHAHFACHGVADQVDGMRSALLLAAVDETDEGLLTADALLDTDLGGARVVVSACDTGINEDRTQAESFGLPRALLAAGCRSVVASLWKTDDAASYLLMRELYRRLESEDAVCAMAGAQLWLRARTVEQIVGHYEEALAAETKAEARARLLLDRAGAEVHAGDFGAACLTYTRVVQEAGADLTATDLARAEHALRLLASRGDLPSRPDYTKRPFAAIELWAPLVLIGDWR
jgi:CHAT domain-containing protein